VESLALLVALTGVAVAIAGSAQLLGHDLDGGRAVPSSTVRACCWSRPTNMTRPALAHDESRLVRMA
jgi:hypothetical protein